VTTDPRKNQIKRQIKDLQRELERLDAIPEPPDGTVVTFSKYFGADRRRYRYAVIRSGRRWYVTGEKAGSYGGAPWESVVSLAAGQPMYAMARGVQLTAEEPPAWNPNVECTCGHGYKSHMNGRGYCYLRNCTCMNYEVG